MGNYRRDGTRKGTRTMRGSEIISPKPSGPTLPAGSPAKALDEYARRKRKELFEADT